MNILYTCDDNYVWLMGISMISLLENNKDMEHIHIYLLGENIKPENKERLYKIGSDYNRQISIIDVPTLNIPNSLVSSRWPLSAFTRLYAAELLPTDIERILYLDCDTIIVGSIQALDERSLDDKLFLGVKDCIGRIYKENIGLNSESIYINAGVLLINLEQLRRTNINVALDSYINKYGKTINYADQDVLNGAFQEHIGEIEPQYDLMTIDAVYSYKEIERLRKPTNFYTEKEMVCAISNPVIIHYTTNMTVVRPWYDNTNHPYANVFIKYKNLSPWKEKKLGNMVFTATEYKIIGLIEKLPKPLSITILGLLHSTIKPTYIKLKSTLK